MAQISGIPIKKQFGQHFLRDERIIQSIVEAVPLSKTDSVFEIGCGDGVLTHAIMQTACARLWVFEIDEQWANYVKKTETDPRLTIFTENILDVDWARFESHAPWILLANLPYQITFPILVMLHRNRHLLREGVIMIQEEVAEKILKTSGRGYGYPSLFYQWYFTWRKLDKVPPTSFYPAPKVNSRLLHFAPKQNVPSIPDEENFWKFIKICFKQPRRTLRNNLAQSHYDLTKIPADLFELRAQQLKMDDLLAVWDKLRTE